MRLSRWGFALLGFAMTLTLAWGGMTVYTFLKERQSEKRITRVEQFVVGIGSHHRVSRPKASRPKGTPKGSGTGFVNPVPETGPAVQGTGTGALAPAHPQGGGPAPVPPRHPPGDRAPKPSEPAPTATSGPSAGEPQGAARSAPGESGAPSEASTDKKPVAEAAGQVIESAGEALTGALCGTTERLQLQTNC